MSERRRQVRRVTVSWVNDLGQAGVLTLDAAVVERHRMSAMVTDHPIEQGPNVADFIRPEPYHLDIDGVVSNTPIYLPSATGANGAIEVGIEGARPIDVQVQGAQPTVGSTIGRPIPIAGALLANLPVNLPRQSATVSGFDPGFDRVRSVRDAFDEIRQRGYLLRVTTTLFEYQNMALEACEIERNAANGDALVFTLSLKQIRVATVDTVAVPAVPTTVKDKGPKPTQKPKAQEEPPPEQMSKAYDLLYN